jgi:hypothetical protein
MTFYAFSKIQPNTKHYAGTTLQISPSTVLIPYRYTLGLQIGTKKDLRPRNWVLGQRGWRGQPESGAAGGVLGWGSGGARPCAHLVFGGGRSWGREVVSELVRRRAAAAAAAS